MAIACPWLRRSLGAWWDLLPPEASEGPSTNERSPTRTVFDVVALPSETPLITAARAAGVDVITGAEVIALRGCV